MAQLTDDCFAVSGPMLPVDELEKIIAERVTPVAEIEMVPLRDARGRVVARVDVPDTRNGRTERVGVGHG